MGDQHHTPPDLFAHLQFADFTARLGGNLHLLTIMQAEGLGFQRVKGHRAGTFILIPFRVPHQGVCIGHHVPAGIEDQRELRGHLQSVGLAVGVDRHRLFF